MEKKKIYEFMQSERPFLDTKVSVEDFLEEILAYKEEGCTHIEVTLELDEYDPDDSTVSLRYYKEREETDEELDRRVLAAKNRHDWAKGRRREQYLKLKEEFEPEAEASQ